MIHGLAPKLGSGQKVFPNLAGNRRKKFPSSNPGAKPAPKPLRNFPPAIFRFRPRLSNIALRSGECVGISPATRCGRGLRVAPGFRFGFLPKKNRARQTPFRPICRALQKSPPPRARRRRRPSAVSRGGLSSRGRGARIRRVFPRRRSPSRPYWCACPCRGACCSL